MLAGLRIDLGETDMQVGFKKLARATPGFVGADLRALTREAATIVRPAPPPSPSDSGSKPLGPLPSNSLAVGGPSQTRSGSDLDQTKRLSRSQQFRL